MTKAEIIILDGTSENNFYGNIVVTSIEDFAAEFAKCYCPQYVLLPVTEDACGCKMYIVVEASKMIYEFEKAAIRYTLKVEYRYDGLSGVIQGNPVTIKPQNFLEYYQTLWNLSRITFYHRMMNTPVSGWSVPCDEFKIVDVNKFQLAIKESNRGDFRYNFNYSDDKTECRYVYADEILNNIRDVSYIRESDIPYHYDGFVWMDIKNNIWTIADDTDVSEGEYLFPMEGDTNIILKQMDWLFLDSFLTERKTFQPCLNMTTVLYDRKQIDDYRAQELIRLRGIEVVGANPTDNWILDVIDFTNLSIENMMPIILDPKSYFNHVCFFMNSVDNYVDLSLRDISEYGVLLIISGRCDATHRLYFMYGTHDLKKSAFLEYLEITNIMLGG